MATLTPYIGKSNDRLTAMINKDNKSTLQEGVHFTYGAVEDHTDADGRNSKIVLTPVPGTKFKEAAEVYFWRLDLAVLGELPAGSIDKVYNVTLPTSIHQLLPRINAALGLTLQPAEVKDTAIATQVATADIEIEAGSLAWLAGTKFTIDLDEGDSPEGIPLVTVITQPDLSGLEYMFN